MTIERFGAVDGTDVLQITLKGPGGVEMDHHGMARPLVSGRPGQHPAGAHER